MIKEENDHKIEIIEIKELKGKGVFCNTRYI
jgi:hypothetical protein